MTDSTETPPPVERQDEAPPPPPSTSPLAFLAALYQGLAARGLGSGT